MCEPIVKFTPGVEKGWGKLPQPSLSPGLASSVHGTPKGGRVGFFSFLQLVKDLRGVLRRFASIGGSDFRALIQINEAVLAQLSCAVPPHSFECNGNSAR